MYANQMGTHIENKDQEKNKYIQNVAVKYGFPLDDEEILESDYLQLNDDALEEKQEYTYKVSMDTVHTYTLGKEKSLAHQFRQVSEQTFNLSVIVFEDGKECVIGNAPIPVEDIVDIISDYDNKVGMYREEAKKSTLRRVLIIYGTSFCQREGCFIGKLDLEIAYS